MSELGKLFELYGYDPERFEDITFLIYLHYKLPIKIIYSNNEIEYIENYPINPKLTEIEILKKFNIVETYGRKIGGIRREWVFISDNAKKREDFQDLVEERYQAILDVTPQIDMAFRYPLMEIARKTYVTQIGIYGSAKMDILENMSDFSKLEGENPLLSFYEYYLQLYNKTSWKNLLEALLIEGWILYTNYIFSTHYIWNTAHYRVSKELSKIWSNSTTDDRMIEQLYHEPDCLAIFCLGYLTVNPNFDCLKFIKNFDLDPNPIWERMFEINEEIRSNYPYLKASRLIRFVEKQPLLIVGDSIGYLSKLNESLPNK